MALEKRRFKANSIEELIIPRFLSKVRKIPHPRGCWIWDGSVSVNTGYGKIHFLNGTYLTHRVSYMLFKGRIPEKHFVLHSCDNPRCVNPEHLSVGTPKQNTHDMIRKGRFSNGRGKYKCR